jgi:hypothetical protein
MSGLRESKGVDFYVPLDFKNLILPELQNSPCILKQIPLFLLELLFTRTFCYQVTGRFLFEILPKLGVFCKVQKRYKIDSPYFARGRPKIERKSFGKG